MKFNKKATGLFAALILSATFMAGCGCSSNQEGNTTPPVTEEQVSGASTSNNASDLIAHLSANGGWIFGATGDITVEQELIVEGAFHDKNLESNALYRKLALYAQDADHNVTDEYVLTLKDGMTVKSPNFNVVNGTIVGDVYVEVEGFQLNGKLDGNLTFATEEAKNTADINGEVTGNITVGNASDLVSSASISNEASDLVAHLGANGGWIFAATGDITVAEELVVDGNFHDKDIETNDLYRKLALYTQDAERNVEEEFTLTLENGMVVKSPNFNVMHGTIVGDVLVEAEGFQLNGKLDGNLTFATEELRESAEINGEVTGEISVK